jgi:hypothetical protein
MLEFEGDRKSLEAFLKTLAGKFYIYELCRPDGSPFYVGKGLNRRALEHEAEARRHHPIGESNPIKCNVIRKIIRDRGEIVYRVVASYDVNCQQECLEHEAKLILKYRRLHEGGILTNLAGGLGNFSGAAPLSLNRHAATLSGEPDDNPERALLNRFLQSIGPVDSVPVKPARQLSRILPTKPHTKPRKPKPRQAYALIASASCSGVQLTSDVVLPRSFSYEGVDAIIENGVASDILKSQMASLVPAANPSQESFRLSDRQIDVIVFLVGRDHLIKRGLL